MPNHVNNKYTVSGPEVDVEAFVKQARGGRKLTGDRIGKGYLFVLDAGESLPVGEENDFEFDRLVPLPDEYGFKSYNDYGYDAERLTWGVKWGAYNNDIPDVTPGMVTWEFTTAWSPPDEFTAKLSEKWPSLLFVVSYSGEGPCLGCFAWRNGEEIARVVGDIDTSPEEEADEDEFWEKYNEWVNQYWTAHDDFVDDCAMMLAGE
jgi:hypothetical protein